MTTEPGGPRTVGSRQGAGGEETMGPRQPRRRARIAVGAVVIVLFVALLVARHAVAGFLLGRALSIATGDRVEFGSFVVGLSESVVYGLHVGTPDGDDLLDADRITVRYSLTDALVGHHRRFGLTGVDVERPMLTIVRHADGGYNIAAAKATGGITGAGGTGPPFVLTVGIHNGAIRLLDRAPVSADLREQRFDGLAVDGRLDAGGTAHATGHASFIGRRSANAVLARWPIALRATIDVPRGVAMARVRAARLPLRGVIGFVQHSAAVRVDDGVVHALAVDVFSLNIGLERPADVNLGGRGTLSGGLLTLSSLRQPVRNLRGDLRLTDDGLWTSGLAGTLAGVPVTARGGVYHRLAPTLRLGVAADGDLQTLRSIFAFSRSQPIAGRAHIETLIEAPVSNILIRTALRVPHGAYGALPLDDVAGRVDYHASSVVIDGVSGRYGDVRLGVGGRVLLGGPAADTLVALAARGAGRGLPYAENLAPEATVDALALISGRAAYRARGAIGVLGPGIAGRGTFAVDERGVGDFGPFTFERADGSSLIGALRLDRPSSQSAAWISARGYRLDVPTVAGRFPGLRVPAFPPIAGVLDASVAGGGTPDRFLLLGRLSGRNLRVGSVALGAGEASLGGRFGDVRLSGLRLAGPLGTFGGAAAVADGTFALRGDYAGSLERLTPLTGPQLAHGAVSGPVAATLVGSNVVVQSSGAILRGGSVRGVGLDAAAGTLAVRGRVLHVVVADGSIGGRRAVARESSGRIAVSAPDLPSGALRGTGLPLDAGNLSVYGLADLRGPAPRFAGTLAVAAGRAHGYPVAGDAQVDLNGPHATIFAATGALGSTYGDIDGAIDGIGQGDVRLDLGTRVSLGDLGLLRGDLGLPVRHLAGSFAAGLRVTGSGSRPSVTGRIAIPEGVYNGLAFRDGAVRLALDGSGITAREGTLTVGSSRTTLAASIAAGRFDVAIGAPRADLADFDDYFDAGDTLAGRGRFDIRFQNDGRRTATAGSIALTALRYRRFPFGDTTADWSMNGAAIVGRGAVRGAAGRADATVNIVPAAGEPIRALRNGSYDGNATLAGIDLGTWLPAAGFSQPVLGTLGATLRVSGRFPALAAGVDATLTDATVAGIAIRSANVKATGRGTRVVVSSSAADLGFATLAGSGVLGLGDRDPLAFDLRTSTDDVGRAMHRFIPAARELDVAGALDADIRLSGTRAKPQLAGGFDVTNARYGSFAIPRAIGAVALAGRAIELRDADIEFGRGQAFVAGSLPLTIAPFGLGPPGAPVSFDVTARGVDLAQFSPLLPAGTKLGGIVDGRFGVEGTVDRPRMLGAVSIAGGSYRSTFERAPIRDFNARLAFNGSRVALEAFHADVGTGTLDAGGEITLPLGNAPHTSYGLDVRAKAAELDFPAYGRGTIDGAVRLTGGSARPLVTGKIALRNAVIPVAAVYGSAATPGGATGTPAFAIDPALAIHAAAGNDVRIRNGIVDVGITGAVDVAGTLRAPRLAGAFTATDGTISSYNHVFRLVNASATFNPADGLLPTIDARATARVTNPDPDPSRNVAGSANITVSVSGTPDSNNLQVAYSSDPPYSQEQIVGLLLDVPALLGAVNFNLNGGPGGSALRGAPGETNALLPPGVTPEQVSAISFNQEVFSLLNGQFTQRALTPIERVFEKIFGLSDLEFTVDYGGGIGYSLRRQIGKRDFYAFLSQTVTYPERTNFGFELEPKPFETVNFSYYQQNGITSLITNQTPGEAFFSGSTRRLTSVQPLGNRSGFSLNFNRRF